MGQTDPPDIRAIDLSAGANHACAVTDAHELVCWGDRDYLPASLPAHVLAVATWGDTCVIEGNGNLFCWDSPLCSLTDGCSTAWPDGAFVAVDVGVDATCAVAATGDVRCWGDPRSQALAPPSGRFVDIAVGHGVACGVLDTGGLSCWGSEAFAAPAGRFTGVDIGQMDACGITHDGKIECWGHDFYGIQDAP